MRLLLVPAGLTGIRGWSSLDSRTLIHERRPQMDAKEVVTLSKEELQQILELFTSDADDELPDTYTLYRYEEQPD
jgi:hypothetical protein